VDSGYRFVVRSSEGRTHHRDFFIEYSDSFSEDERKFEEGPRKRMLEEITLWINMFFMEGRMMRMDPDRMGE
jgi:hypothetical protein